MRELFVWYRVQRRDAPRARDAVHAMQRSLVIRCPGLHARLLVRIEGDAAQTWMEIYSRGPTRSTDGVEATAEASAGSGIDAATEALIASASSALDGLIDGARHVEAFEALAPR